jgi:hypothetical protein
MTTSQPAETEVPQIVNLSQVSVETVQAELVRASQTTVQQLNADEVDLQTSLVGTLQAGDVHARDSIIGTLASQQAALTDCFTGGLRADTLSFNGVAALVLANSMANKEVNAIALVGKDVQADSIHTGILISREVHGNVNATLDGRTALMAGLVAGAVTGLIVLAGRLLFRRNQ